VADRSKRARVLKAFLIAAIAAGALSSSVPAEAHNTWVGGLRKWPWKAGTDQTLTTLPGECPHCSGAESSSAWKAIDANMYYETVYAITNGGLTYEPSGGKAGIYVQIKSPDGTYITYEHLKQALVTSGSVVAGQPIAISGCTGNCSGAHLHFQRQNGTGFSSTALDLVPISGHGGSNDALQHTAYTSDNAGIGYSSGGTGSSAIRSAYAASGGYSGVGVTADVGEGWSPCRYEGVTSTWWRYGCSPKSGVSGSVQTFYKGQLNSENAIMQESGSSNAYVIRRGILGAYTDAYAGHDWVYYLGYPTGNRYVASSGVYRQNFRYGYITFTTSNCMEKVYLGTTYKDFYSYCD
jgi:hypothetical protein